MVLKYAKLAPTCLMLLVAWGTGCGQKSKSSNPVGEKLENGSETAELDASTQEELGTMDTQRILNQMTDNIVISNQVVNESNCASQANIITFWTDLNNNKTFDQDVDSDRNEVTLCPEELSAEANQGGEIQMSQFPGHSLRFDFHNVSNKVCEFGGIQVVFSLTNGKIVSPEAENLGRVTFTLCNQKVETVVVKHGKDGKDGKNGIDGKDGKDGINGKDGKNGIDGINGKDGIDGKDGKDGINGINGKDGIDGKDGKDGINGINGKDGIDGKDGKDGINGINGKDGADGKDGKDGIDGKDGENYVNEFVATYFNEFESIEFDLNRYTHVMHLSSLESVIVYGQFSYHKTGVQNILVFEPQFHECLAEDQSNIVLSQEEFMSSLAELYQEKRSSYDDELKHVQAELENATLMETDLVEKLESTLQLKAQEATLLTNLTALGADLSNQVSATEVFVQEAKQNQGTLKASLLKSQEDNGQSSAKVQEQKLKVEGFKKQIDELNKQKQNVSGEIATVSSTLDKTKADLKVKNQQLDKIKNDTKKTQDEVAELERQLKKANIFTYDGIKLQLDNKKSSLIRLLVEKDQTDDAIASLNTAVSNLQNNLQAHQSRLSSIEATLVAANSQYTKEQEELKLQVSANGALTQQTSELQTKLSEASSLLNSLELKLSDLKSKLVDNQAAIVQSQRKHKEFEIQAFGLQDDLTQQSRIIAGLQDDQAESEFMIKSVDSAFLEASKQKMFQFEFIGDSELALWQGNDERSSFAKTDDQRFAPEQLMTCDQYIAIHLP